MMGTIKWRVMMLGAIAPIGVTIFGSVAIAQITPYSGTVPISDALDSLYEYHQNNNPLRDDDSPSASATILIPEPAPVPEALHNLVNRYQVSRLQEDGMFDADEPMLRRDYIIYTAAAFDNLEVQLKTYFLQETEKIDTPCLVLEMTVRLGPLRA